MPARRLHPAKVFLHHAEIYDTFKNAKEFGIDVKEFTLNWPVVLARRKDCQQHAKGIEFLFRKNKVESMQGWGRWAGPGRVSVENGGKITEVEATHILFATGSAARSLPVWKLTARCPQQHRDSATARRAEVAGHCRCRGGRR